MNTKHTPGPWTFGTSDDTNYMGELEPDSFYVQEDGGCRSVIAELDSLCEGDKYERYANARLIAAAPELLEAAKQVIWKMRHHYKDAMIGDNCRYTGPALIGLSDATVKMLEAAIEKATHAKAEGGN